MARAATLPGKSIVVGLVLWQVAGSCKRRTFKLERFHLERFGLHPKTASRGLSRLESAKLVTVDRHRGRSPVVTILDAPGDEETRPPDT